MDFSVADRHGLQCGLIVGVLSMYFLQDGRAVVMTTKSQHRQGFLKTWRIDK